MSGPQSPTLRRSEALVDSILRYSREMRKGDGKPGSEARDRELTTLQRERNRLWLLRKDTYGSATMRSILAKQKIELGIEDPNEDLPVGSDGSDVDRWGQRLESPLRELILPTASAAGSPEESARECAAKRRDPDRRTASSTVSSVREELVKPPRSLIPEERPTLTSAAQKAYREAYSGLQATGDSGRTVLEEMVEAAMRKCDAARQTGQRLCVGACVATDAGRMFAGCNVESTSDPCLSVSAARTAILKAVSEGERHFQGLVIATSTGSDFPAPDGQTRQFLADFGDFPVYLVDRDMRMERTSSNQLFPLGESMQGSGPRGSAADMDAQIAGLHRGRRDVREWTVADVLDWVEFDLELPSYRANFAKSRVDGAMLLQLKDDDVCETGILQIPHFNHQRRILHAVEKLRDDMAERRVDNEEMDSFLSTLDVNRFRLVAKLKVAFDAVNGSESERITAKEAAEACRRMGVDIEGNKEAASWLADIPTALSCPLTTLPSRTRSCSPPRTPTSSRKCLTKPRPCRACASSTTGAPGTYPSGPALVLTARNSGIRRLAD